jgi:hypothetical protein
MGSSIKSIWGDINSFWIASAGFEPSQTSVDAILSFASQYEVLHSRNAGSIELNLN